MKKEELLNREALWDECALAFNAALAKANQQYPYRWERINQAKEQIKQMIQKPEVTEEWIEEKAKKLDHFFSCWWDRFGDFDTTPEKERDAEFAKECKDFIRSFIEEGKV